MDPPILVLDEATASVDTATESAIHEELLEVMKGRTTFIIAQRLSSVKRADRIIVLDRGQIVQQGTHKELFEQEGFFRNLFEMQEAASVRAKHYQIITQHINGSRRGNTMSQVEWILGKSWRRSRLTALI